MGGGGEGEGGGKCLGTGQWINLLRYMHACTHRYVIVKQKILRTTLKGLCLHATIMLKSVKMGLSRNCVHVLLCATYYNV